MIMGVKSKIHWLFDPYLGVQGATWNLWYGCTRFSPACSNCYISRQTPLRVNKIQFDKAGIGGKTPIMYAPRKRLFEPLTRQWEQPLMIFIESLGDLWHGAVPITRTAEVFAIMLLCPQHIFLTLTKRTKRMRNWLRNPRFTDYVREALEKIIVEYPRIAAERIAAAWAHLSLVGPYGSMVPLPNVWIGTTVEDNPRAQERISLLYDTPATLRWWSCEPLTNELEDPLDLTPWLYRRPEWGPAYTAPTSRAGILVQDLVGGQTVDWVVLGGESGPPAKATTLDTTPAVGLRPISLENLERLTHQIAAAGIAPYVKQLGEPWARKAGAADRAGGDPSEWPVHLDVRRYPLRLAHRALAVDPGNRLALAAIGGV